MNALESFIYEATVIFDNDPASRVTQRTPLSPPMPVCGITTGKNKHGHFDGTITGQDLEELIQTVKANGWAMNGEPFSVIVFNPRKPEHAVIAKNVKIK